MIDKLILISIGSTVGLGVFFGTVLAVANKTLKVDEDPKIVTVEEILPGLNCGACGYAGCQAFAIALIAGEAPVNGCLAGGKDVADKLAAFLGLAKKETVKKIALIRCNANDKERTKDTEYSGIKTCGAADLVKGVINCSYGCLGYGDCTGACPFGAIAIVHGLPRVDPSKCTACGKCVGACPRTIISVENLTKSGVVFVACNSGDKGAKVKKICAKGCIACAICQKLSEGVFKIENNLARVDYKLAKSKEVEWAKIMGKCPTKVILKT